MRRACLKLRSIATCSLIVCIMILAGAIPTRSQATTQTFGYAILHFNGLAGSELIISNLSSRLLTPEITIWTSGSSGAQQAIDIFVPIPAGSQQRFTTASFGLSSFSGTVLIGSSAPLNIVATLADVLGNFETVKPAIGTSSLIIPFAPGTTGNMGVTIFNPQGVTTTALISAVAADGSSMGSVQRLVPPFTELTEDVASFATQNVLGQQREISHVTVRTISNIFGAERVLFAQASITYFSSTAENLVGAQCRAVVGLGNAKDEAWRSGRHMVGVWYSTEEDASAHQAAMECVPDGRFAALALAPLSSGRLDPPDIALFYATPGAMIYFINGLQWSGYKRFDWSIVGESACADSWGRALKTREPSLSIPCFAERRYGGVLDDEMLMALPPDYLPKAIAGMEALAKNGLRYPFPQYGIQQDVRAGMAVSYPGRAG